MVPEDHAAGEHLESRDGGDVTNQDVVEDTTRATLSRRTTRDSVPRSSSHQRPTPQLLSSLMAGSSSEEDDESSDGKDFDLHPPASKPKPPSVESLSELLFSVGHFNALLQSPSLLARFTSFMHRYQTDKYPTLMQYVENSKAVAAVEYANAIAASLSGGTVKYSKPKSIAKLDHNFLQEHNATLKSLVSTALPLYITYNLVKITSECLEDEIVGRINLTHRNLVGGLSEVFCLTDPNQEDNPIVFASQEFYRFTGYDRDEMIGHNCRFLQGARTNRESPARIKASLDKGDEVSEVLLNYRRDGRPFINLLMLAPLFDSNGKVVYHIGAQVDVTGLIEGSRALDGFQTFLNQRDIDQQRQEWDTSARPEEERCPHKVRALEKLKDLGELLDHEESMIVQTSSRHGSIEKHIVGLGLGVGANEDTDAENFKPATMVDKEDKNAPPSSIKILDLGKAGLHGISGKLPGVYEKYMLIRPAPSLRILFASSKLQKWGKVIQHPFMSHIATDQATLNGLIECFQTGTPVTAKVKFLLQRNNNRHGTVVNPGSTNEKPKQNKSCWMSATPLLGSDDRVGVWMVVFIELIKGNDRSGRQGVFGRNIGRPELQEMNRRVLRRQSYHRSLSDDIPIKATRLETDTTEPLYAPGPAHPSIPEKAQLEHQEAAYATHERRRTSPSPTANQSRKASPRQQPVGSPAGSPVGSPLQRLPRRRLPHTSDDDEPEPEIL